MKLIDVIEKIRIEEGIPLQQFIEGIMSTHSYKRYVSHRYELKLSQGFALMKKIKRTPESIFEYLSFIHQSPKSKFSLYLQAKVNQNNETLKKLQESLKFIVYDLDQLKDLLVHQTHIESTYQYVYETMMVHDDIEICKKLMSFLDFTYMQKVKDNQYITGILTYFYHHGLYTSSLHQMLKRITNPSFFKSGSWDIPFLMSIHLLNSHTYEEYKKHQAMYETHVVWISRRLTGSLDIGFISHSYKHLAYVYSIKKNPSFNEMLYRYLSTLMIRLDQKELTQEIKQLSSVYTIDMDTFYKQYTKTQIETIINT